MKLPRAGEVVTGVLLTLIIGGFLLMMGSFLVAVLLQPKGYP